MKEKRATLLEQANETESLPLLSIPGNGFSRCNEFLEVVNMFTTFFRSPQLFSTLEGTMIVKSSIHEVYHP